MLKSILMLAYNVELIDVAEKERLLSDVEGRILYTRKAEVYGCCVKLLTELDYVADRWDDNFYSMAENVRSHGRLVVLEEPDRPLTVKYEPLTKTTFLVNVDYYGWVKNIALAVAGEALEDQHWVYYVHGAAIDVEGRGASIIGPPVTGKTTHSWGLIRLRQVRLVSDDWHFVRLSSREPLAFCSEKNCYIEMDIGKTWGEYERLVDKAQFDKNRRAVVNVRWLVGWGGVIPMTTMKHLVLLQRDPSDCSVVHELTSEEALDYLLANGF